KRARGYRYVPERLRARGIRCGERTVRRLMAEEGLVPVYLTRPKRWSSYAGELSDAPENLVARDFRTDAPDRL
ncbi:IS3 family transposase, partial [Acinetobacter sp. 163]|nr:IS3 family transposase [Acinetobacter sp. 163]